MAAAGAPVTRPDPPISLIMAAGCLYDGQRDDLADLVAAARTLLSEQSEIETVTDVWLSLLCRTPWLAAFIAATAIVQVAKQPHGPGRAATEPGS